MSRKFYYSAAAAALSLGGLIFLGLHFSSVLFSQSYLPHRFCYLAQPWLIWTNAPADFSIFLAYCVLFESLFVLAWMVRRQLQRHLWIFLAFGLFILTCGLTHLMEVITIWHPLYPLSTTIKIICALASIPTAIAFQFQLRPLARELNQYLAEIHSSREALIASERLAAVGRLSASISHEINNPLEAVMNLIYLIRTSPQLPEELRPSADLAEQELKRVAGIANHTLTYYRESAQPVDVNLSEVVEGVLTLERARLEAAKVTVTTRLLARQPVIVGHPGEMRQILINLVENSIAALPGGGTLQVSVRPSFRLATGQSGYQLAVADSGAGISAENLRKIFTPFFSTKGASGTGLGLWIVRQIVQKHGGSLRIRSKPGRGTIVVLWLPQDGNPAAGQTLHARSQYHVLPDRAMPVER